MQIILTHEQADFDALASLLGASLVFEDAIPVLPHRMNRNVRAFLSLYGVDLPFVEARDLPSEPVEKVILVDTQSMITVKGVGLKTRVEVIDHHPLRENLPANWSVSTVDLGATTTLLVEELRESNGVLNTIYATLLLIGIYEDTGSLTYTRTTARDLRAAAFLLEQGASLRIAFEYLNHPLSHEQQAIYDLLRSSAENLRIKGHNIVVACGEAPEIDEELSTIVHKLRDLLEPDALFVLVTTRSGVQMIARSASDNIDVAAVVAHFGGGGHERAAAALIRGQTLEAVCADLERVLPEHVRPAIQVSQIMSRGLQVLSPDATAAQAAERMQRFGYEGYPVVGNGKILGLLTRRAVDRAVSLGLDYPVHRLMDSGSYSVYPDDSIEHLQRLVAETGWGQIPVTDPDSGEIIGIVTRTDLLKILTPNPRMPGEMKLSGRLESALPQDRIRLLKAVAEVARLQGAALYIVGGFVRDLLLERPILDFDLVVEGDAIALGRALARQYGGRVTSHSRFGTAKWHLDDPDCKLRVAGLPSIDLVTARTEFYTHPTALPTVERGSIKLDLHRRDFTINTLALRLDGRHYGELHDYWGGLEDLRSHLVRVLHSLSFVDDPTRILRAVRFEQRLSFQIEQRTLQLLQEARPLVERLSGDRIRHELNNILSANRTVQILERLQALDLLSAIHPALTWDAWLADRFEALSSLAPEPEWGLGRPDEINSIRRDLSYTLWLMRLSPDQAKQVAGRLKLGLCLSKAIEAASSVWRDRNFLAGMSPSAAVARLDGVPPLARYALYFSTPDERLRRLLWDYVKDWQMVQPVTTGTDLKALGLPPGPHYRRILEALRGAWLDGKVSSPEQERALLDELVHHGEKIA